MAKSEFVWRVRCAFMTLIVILSSAPVAVSNLILIFTQKPKSSEHPAETKVTESIVEADNVTEVDASDDIDFDDDVDDVDVDERMGPDLFRMISAMMMNYCPIGYTR